MRVDWFRCKLKMHASLQVDIVSYYAKEYANESTEL